MYETSLKNRIACEVGLYLLRKAVRDGLITEKEFEKAATGLAKDLI